MSKALMNRVAKAEEELYAAKVIDPKEYRKLKLSFFRMRGLLHYTLSRLLPGASPSDYPSSEIDSIIREILELVDEAVDAGGTDEDIHVAAKLRGQELANQFIRDAMQTEGEEPRSQIVDPQPDACISAGCRKHEARGRLHGWVDSPAPEPPTVPG